MAKQCGICSFKSDNQDEFNQHAAAAHGLGPLASKTPPPPKPTAAPVTPTTHTAAAPAPVNANSDFVAKGYNGQLTVRDHSIVISRKGALALFTQGLKGDKEISIEHVTSVQLKNAGMTAGYIQFTFMGGQEAKGGVFQAGQDENSVSFYKGSQKDFERAKELIEERRRRASSPSAVQAVLSPAEELTRFAQLHKDGVINDDEFAAKKKQLLGL